MSDLDSPPVYSSPLPKDTFPERIGEWVPERLIGRGAVAEVFLCRGPDDEPVALKWMNQSHAPLVRRFEREIESIQRLCHPGITAYVGHGESEGRPYLVMEHIDGTDLRLYTAKLHKRPSMERYARCRNIGKALCDALEHIHSAGLVHRDVKPSNVLITDDDRVVLSDFGIVKDPAALHKTAMGVVVGTIAYAAPEQIEGEVVDLRTDLFGLGATLYYLLSQQRPFDGVDRREDAQPAPPSRFDPGIPPDLEGLVMRLMAPDPADRPRDARSVRALLTTTASSGTPLAGARDSVALVADCLDRAEAGESLLVRPVGPMGTRKAWIGDMLRLGAQRRSIPVVEVLEAGAWSGVRDRLETQEHLLVISPLDLTVPSHMETVEIRLEPLGVADVRRSLISVAPDVENAAWVAAELHARTGGLPRLLVSILESAVQGEELQLPPEDEIHPEVERFFEGLELDEIEVLGAVALAREPLDVATIEHITNVPADDVLPELVGRGMVVESAGCFRLTGSLFREAVQRRLADPEGLIERITTVIQERSGPRASGIPSRIMTDIRNGIEKAEQALLGGALGAGLRATRRSVDLAQAMGDRNLESEALIALANVLIRVGLLDEASRRLADATALAHAVDRQDLRRLSHALRAWVAMDKAPRSRTAAASAIDRILPMLSGAAGRGHLPEDAMLYATWARAAAVLGDRGSHEKACQLALTWGGFCEEPLRLGIRLQIARGLLALADGEGAQHMVAPVLAAKDRYPLLGWEALRIIAVTTGALPPEPGEWLSDMDPESARSLMERPP